MTGEVREVVSSWVVVLEERIHELIDISEERDSVRSPGWYRAICNDCGSWDSTGLRDVVEQAAQQHVIDEHLDFVDVHLRDGSGRRAGIVSYPPPGVAITKGGPHAAVSVCGLEACTDSAASWVRVVTDHDGVFRLDPQAQDPNQGVLFDPAAPVPADPAAVARWSDADMYRTEALLTILTENVHPEGCTVPVSVRAAEALRSRDRDRARIRELEAELSRTADKLALSRRQLETVRSDVDRVRGAVQEMIEFGAAQDARP